MAKFRVLESRRSKNIGQADLVVEWLDGCLATGDSFVVYDTHHPIGVAILGSVPQSGGAILRCDVTLGWDGQFVGSVVHTEASDRRAAFGYETEAHPDLAHVRTLFLDGRVVVEVDDDELCDFVEDFLSENCVLTYEHKAFGAAALTVPA